MLVVPSVAVSFAATVLETAVVVTLNVAVFAPAAIVTVVGVDASLLLLVKVTAIPPVGAAVPIVTVPFATFPPTKDAGLNVSPVITGGLIVKVVVASTMPPDFA